MTRRLALHHLCAREIEAEALVEIAAGLGVPDVTLFVRPPSRRLDIFPAVRDEAHARKVRARLDDAGVGVHDIEAFAIGPRTEVAALEPDLARGALLGARRATALLHDEDEARALDRFGTFCDLAAGFGIEVSVEFMAFSSLSTLEDCAAFVASSGKANASVLVDALHLRRTGGSPEAIARLRNGIVGAAQVCDAPLEPGGDAFAEAVENRMVPGEGELPLAAFLAALPASVPIDMEVPLDRLRESGIDAAERARLIVTATRRLLAQP